MAVTRKDLMTQMKYETAKKNIDLIYELAQLTDLTSEQKKEFVVRYMDLEKCYEDFVSLYYEIQLKAEDSELDKHNVSYESYNKKYYAAKRRHFELFGSSPKADNGVGSSDGNRQAGSRAVLPRLQIPTFSGKIEEYVSFKELFQSLVGNDTTLSDTEKMYYLTGSLTGEPKALIQHLSITGDNFSIAMDLLNSRYNNKRLLADRLLYNLFSVQNVGNKNISGLKLFLNTLSESTKALDKMGFPIDSWSYLLFYINFQKLDSNLKKHFEDKVVDKELPTFADLIKFLETEVRILESSAEPPSSASAKRGGGPSHAVKAHAVFNNAGSSCKLCGKGGHFIVKCDKFLAMAPAARKRHVVAHNLCFRCLNGHNIERCNYNGTCYKCNSTKHHYLLHFDLPATVPERQQRPATGNGSSGRIVLDVASANAPSTSAPSTSGPPVNAVPGTTGLMASHVSDHGVYQRTVLLATAVVRVLDSSGTYQEARALLDGGSQGTFVSEACASRLGLKRFNSNTVTVTGLSGIPVSGCRGGVNLNIIPKYADQPTLMAAATVLNKITHKLPSFTLPSKLAGYYDGLCLADEQFFISREIDILIGADLLGDILLGGELIRINDDLPCAMSTVFGHVLTGPVNFMSTQPCPQAAIFTQTFFCNAAADRILERFWEVEDIPDKVADPKDLECEAIFANTHQRDETGRYIARLPLLSDKLSSLGNSVPLATKRFLAMEKRLQVNEDFRAKYVNFMREYLETGHMSLCDGSNNDNASGKDYVIPHHGIFKADSDKIRVVFDASCSTSSGVSLNDCLHAGPKLQRDIAEIICRFRLHEFVFTTDIRMMFRQILIADEDRQFQRILWRESPELPLYLYQLNTVTYGMKSSPYLAIRTLRQLAEDEEARYPAAAHLLRSSVYMDDIFGGAETLEDAKALKQELTGLLHSGGFELSKWTANDKQLLEDVPMEHLEKPRIFDNADGPGFFKILGIQWDPSSDSFSYRTRIDEAGTSTKRSILSTLARTFDPLGWITPVIFQGKVLMQRLWLLNLSWDEQPPADVTAEWQGILADLPLISQLRLKRFALKDSETCSLHGFADASELGYGAAVYLRSGEHDGEAQVHLMMAKSRVAAVKSKLTIPKLELSASALLVRLMKYVVESIKHEVDIEEIVCWSDSTIVLSWLRISPHLLQTFEGNRVSQIVNCGLGITWRHLPSEMNPADVASRGCRASDLLGHTLWWGPYWLKGSADTWPVNIMDKESDLPGMRKTPVKVHTTTVELDSVFTRFSSLSKLLAVVAYCFRFVNNAKGSSSKLTGVLTVPERKFALERLVKLAQEAELAEDIDSLKRDKRCSTRLRRLMPFISQDGLLRVGGRLQHSNLPFSGKHPAVLPKRHPLTALIVDHFHVVYCHVGATTLLSILQRQYWIISATQVVRTRIFKCIKCFRTKAKSTEPMMAALPGDRVNATGVFHTVQTDFAGPFIIKHSRVRNAKTLKAYLCVFICSSTKCVHLECVIDLSTDGFLATLTRFTSRRGLPRVIRSDCGTNYVGTNRHLNEVQKYLASREVQQELVDKAGQHNITWCFNPPGAPHFGGLFEATVKSAKTLLRRVIGEQVLTFEELVTVFTRIEAVLNSRPLCPLTQDPHDCEVLTPAHFLIGRPLLSVPEYSFEDIPDSRLNRFNLIQAISQRFWRKWSDQYLHSLQMRHKWTSPTDPPQAGDLVLIKEENLPPLKWRLGRITELLPGRDGVVRVVRLKTSTGTMTRPVVKICRLPLD